MSTPDAEKQTYFPAGNYLIANVNNDPESMAVAWLSGGGATAMIFFFPERLKRPKLGKSQKWQAVLDKNFLVIYNPGFKPDKKYTILLDVDG